MNIKQSLGLRVKELRIHNGYSQKKFSQQCHLDRTYIVSLENGHRNVSIENIEKITKTLHISLTEFFDSELFE